MKVLQEYGLSGKTQISLFLEVIWNDSGKDSISVDEFMNIAMITYANRKSEVDRILTPGNATARIE